MTLKEIAGAFNELSIDELKSDMETEGTFAYRVVAAYYRFHELLVEAKEHGYVGVGCITYAEQLLDEEGFTL